MNADKHRFKLISLSAFICVHLWLNLLPLSAAPRWNIQFFYDHAGSNFDIEDLECPTPQHCVAGGLIDDKNGRQQGAVVVTSDGGLHWSQFEVKERPLSLFFLNAGQGWMVTDRGLWSTVEGGRTWVRIQSRKGILQAWFLDPNHGYITGLKGLVEETTDGGRTWARLAAANQLANAQFLNFDIIAFYGRHGVLVGAPDASAPSLSNALSETQGGSPSKGRVSVLETLDGGQKWTSGTIPIDGDLAQLRMSNVGTVVSLILYPNPKYPVGSAIFETHLGRREGRILFAEHDRTATDIALLDNGSAVLATIEPAGNSTHSPIPGKLKIFESSGDLKIWQEMNVDYRVVAQRAVIAAPDAHNIWVATDTGAILKLAE